MPKTIRELANELKVSKQTIQYHYQRLPAKNQQKNSQGSNLISPTAERIIRGKVAKPLVTNDQQKSSKEATNNSKENNDLIATLRREVADLKSQRDKQLATKDQQIDHLTKLVDQQQQLQLATVAENHELTEHVKKLSSLIEISKPVQQKEDGKGANLPVNSNPNHIRDKKKPCKKSKINWLHFW